MLAFLHELCGGSADDLLELLVVLGRLFHEIDGDRKSEPCLWLHGVNSTYKSWFMMNFLKHNFSDALVHYVDRGSGPFRYESLLGVNRGVIHIDDFRSEDFRSEAGTLINLADGVPFMAKRKYHVSELVISRHNIALTTNESPTSTVWSSVDVAALSKRFTAVFFNGPAHPVSKDFLLSLMPEFTGLALYCNYVYILRTYSRKTSLPRTWPLNGLELS